MQARLGFILQQCKVDDTPRSRLIAHLLLEGNPQRIKDLFDGEQYAPERLNDEEMSFIEAFKVPNYPETVAAECPPAYEVSLRELFGCDFALEMQAMQMPATLDLRVNLARCTLEMARAALKSDGVETEKTAYSPWGLRCEHKAYLSKTKAYMKGWVEIQDEGSQLIAHACAAKPGMQVLDYCAGAGGKTIALAAAMQNKGRIVAMDLEERRLMKARERIKKAGVSDIIELRPLSDEKHRKWLKRQKGTFDLALCDVPCSGTGTWRRNPDMRWRAYGPALDELIMVQKDILDKVKHTVKEGGKLVYATCSLLREENEAQVEEFLKNNPDYVLHPINMSYAKDMMRLTPYQHQTDGFFAAVMMKKNN
jgi:16S rRNA (cytosine967-C5)-methyltransferase